MPGYSKPWLDPCTSSQGSHRVIVYTLLQNLAPTKRHESMKHPHEIGLEWMSMTQLEGDPLAMAKSRLQSSVENGTKLAKTGVGPPPDKYAKDNNIGSIQTCRMEL